MKNMTDGRLAPVSTLSERVIFYPSWLRGKDKIFLLFLLVLYMVLTPSVNQCVGFLPIGAEQAFANGKTKALSDGQVVPINDVLYPYNARMPSSGGVSLEIFVTRIEKDESLQLLPGYEEDLVRDTLTAGAPSFPVSLVSVY